MYSYINIFFSTLMTLLPLASSADAVTDLQTLYTKQAKGPFSTSRGESLWNQDFRDAGSGQSRSCVLCHKQNLQQAGKHAKTGKPIKPMAPSVNPDRLTDSRKIEKWFKRNCKWTLGRECSAQEKGDLLSFLNHQ
jgi:hypothetical protein